MDILWLLWELAINAVEILLAYYLYSRKMEVRSGIRAIIGGILLFSLVSIMNYMQVPVPIALTINTFGYIAYSCFAFRGSVITRILWGCVPPITINIGDVLTMSLISLVDSSRITTSWEPGRVRFFAMVAYILMRTVMILVIANVGNTKNKKTYNMSRSQLIFFIGIIIISIVAVNLQTGIAVELSEHTGTEKAQADLIMVSMIILIILVSLIFFAYALGKETQTSAERYLDMQQAKLESEYYKANEISVSALRELRHDTSTHIQVMRTLLEQGKYDDLEKYFNSMESEYKIEDSIFSTDNTMLNALLTSKKAIAKEHGIDIRLSYSTKKEIPLSPVDLCSLIGNLIDNAIDANRKIKDIQNRYIDIAIGDKGDMAFIRVENPSDGKYVWMNGELRTTQTGIKHGYGLRRIRKIAESIGGFCEFEPSPDAFTATVIFPHNFSLGT